MNLREVPDSRWATEAVRADVTRRCMACGGGIWESFNPSGFCFSQIFLDTLMWKSLGANVPL